MEPIRISAAEVQRQVMAGKALAERSMMSKKLCATALVTFGLWLCWVVNGYADRLYTWTDAKGVTHITQDPPPEAAKVVDTIDYSPQPDQPVRRPTPSDRPNQPQGNPGQRAGQAGQGTDAGLTSGDASNDVEYDYTGGPYRQTLRRYERRHEWLDHNEPGKVGDLPGRVRPRPRMR
jgi:hypothetical protein